MTDNITKLYPSNAASNPDNVLEQALGVYDDVLIMGYDKDGNLDVRASDRFGDGGEVLWVIEQFKHKLLNMDYVAE